MMFSSLKLHVRLCFDSQISKIRHGITNIVTPLRQFDNWGRSDGRAPRKSIASSLTGLSSNLEAWSVCWVSVKFLRDYIPKRGLVTPNNQFFLKMLSRSTAQELGVTKWLHIHSLYIRPALSVRLVVGRPGFVSRRVGLKYLSWYSQLPCLTFNFKGKVWRSTWQDT